MGAFVCVCLTLATDLKGFVILACTGLRQSIVSKSLFSVDSQEMHCGIACPPKACRLTMGL